MDVAKLAKEFVNALEQEKKQPQPYDTTAVVKRVEGGTAYVVFAGAETETPVKMTIDVKKGDNVQVRVGGGRAWITGNATRPPTDDAIAILSEKVAKIADVKATQADVKAVEAQDTAVDAKKTAKRILIYDTTYTMSGTTANFEAFVYQGGIDIKTQFDSSMFSWYLKTEDGTSFIGTGYTATVQTTSCGYGAEVIGTFTITNDAEALDLNDDVFTTYDNQELTVRAVGDAVRVRDLTVVTSLYSTDKLMVVGSSDEHLVTIQTLQDYLDAHMDKQVLFDTTANWDAQTTLQSQANTLYIYTDHQTDSSSNPVAGIKVGDGNAYVVDLPFTDAVATEHIADNIRHTTSAEKAFWNDKVRCYYAGGNEELIFTTS